MLAVTLPEHKYTQSYDLTGFVQTFPDSLITNAYEVSS